MRLLSITLRNYRIHRDITVDFDPSRNLIGGTNETGKSTLAEAIHRALFMRSGLVAVCRDRWSRTFIQGFLK